MTIPNSDSSAILALNETREAINEWLKENPVLVSEDEARTAKKMLDRGKLANEDLEAERDGKVRPLNTEVRAINDSYRPHREGMERIISVVEGRIASFLYQEKRRAEQAAAEAARIVAEKEAAAREAERLEKEKLADAAEGELDVDVGEVTSKADEAFAEYQAADRALQRAEKAVDVRIGGGFKRSISLRKRETLKLVDIIEVLDDLGVPEAVETAVLTAARAYRKVHGKLPRGIEATYEEGL
jgi:hypothetical protein